MKILCKYNGWGNSSDKNNYVFSECKAVKSQKEIDDYFKNLKLGGDIFKESNFDMYYDLKSDDDIEEFIDPMIYTDNNSNLVEYSVGDFMSSDLPTYYGFKLLTVEQFKEEMQKQADKFLSLTNKF